MYIAYLAEKKRNDTIEFYQNELRLIDVIRRERIS